MTFNKF